MKIRGKVAVVTGASSGLGAEMARQLARAGLKVGLIARRRAELGSVASSILAAGGIAQIAVADMTDPATVRSSFEAIVADLGPVDVLVANAGIGLGTEARTFSGSVFERMVQVNLVGVAHAIEAVLPSMIERGEGQIVGISSLAAFRGLPGSAGYCATKAGLSALLEGLRPELKRLGVAVTTVHPGYVRTPMTAGQTNFQPLLMEVEPAARLILRGIAARRSRVDFPWGMATLLRLVQILPDRLYDPLVSRLLLGSRR